MKKEEIIEEVKKINSIIINLDKGIREDIKNSIPEDDTTEVEELINEMQLNANELVATIEDIVGEKIIF